MVGSSKVTCCFPNTQIYWLHIIESSSDTKSIKFPKIKIERKYLSKRKKQGPFSYLRRGFYSILSMLLLFIECNLYFYCINEKSINYGKSPIFFFSRCIKNGERKLKVWLPFSNHLKTSQNLITKENKIRFMCNGLEGIIVVWTSCNWFTEPTSTSDPQIFHNTS